MPREKGQRYSLSHVQEMDNLDYKHVQYKVHLEKWTPWNINRYSLWLVQARAPRFSYSLWHIWVKRFRLSTIVYSMSGARMLWTIKQ